MTAETAVCYNFGMKRMFIAGAVAAFSAGLAFSAECPQNVREQLAAAANRRPGTLTAKIAEKHKIVQTDLFHGFVRTTFDFRGCRAWVVEPACEPAKGHPWTWTMQWATAFVPRTPVLHLLRQGWRHVTIDTFKYKMNDEGREISKAFQDYLVGELGFAPRACLVGMSWGGFFSVRYTAFNPDGVAAIYLDAPLLNFDSFLSQPREKVMSSIGVWSKDAPEKWSDDPRMPVNMAEGVAKSGAPVYLLYGGADRVVPPAQNCKMFMPRLKAAGVEVKEVARGAYAHHPHGLEVDDPAIAEFFKKAFASRAAAKAK